ncbi:circadian clock KaiB family protein [Pseudocnuella soli]|uniref:circadian clock KaiB family protein n=1 Tax=Pseudocnuella soli TaxID=2502779 RepID=UPI001043309A|nr:circadian clock KaiB family protein [Pseudocnuella soli]
MAKLNFQIFIAGKSSRNSLLVRYFEEACGSLLAPNSFEITVIDLARNAQLAEQHKILATPTISRLRPLPEKRIIGSLTQEGAQKALTFLTEDLNHSQHEKS